MAGQSKTTTDHEVIKHWVEERGGKPTTVRRTEAGDEPGVLRIDFPGYGRDEGRHSLEEISWDEFFQKFDEKDLAFLYQDEMKSGKPSRFFKFVSRGTAEAKEEQKSETASRRKSEGQAAKAEKPAAQSRKTGAEAKAKDDGKEQKKTTAARGQAKSAEAKTSRSSSTSRTKAAAGGESRAERDAKQGEAKKAGSEAKQEKK